MSAICTQCGKESGTVVPSAVFQPILDELAFRNPETLSEGLRPGETVLVLCRANVGGLAATDRRLLVVKDGQIHEHSYTDVEDIVIEKVGWFLDAVFELVTAETPHQAMKSKAADRAPNALSLIRPWLPIFEAAKVRILEIRDARKCRSCGAFVPITSGELDAAGRPQPLEPIPNSGAAMLAANLEPGERILCQAHGAGYYKTMIVTDRRVMIVLGRGEKYFHVFPLTAVEGVEVDAEGLQLRIKSRAFQKLQGMALVTADSGIPGKEGDLYTLGQVAGVIHGLLQASAP